MIGKLVERCLDLEGSDKKFKCLLDVKERYCSVRINGLKERILSSSNPSTYADEVDSAHWCAVLSGLAVVPYLFDVDPSEMEIRYARVDPEEVYITAVEDARKPDKLFAYALSIGCGDRGASLILSAGNRKVVFKGHTNAVAKAICGKPVEGIEVALPERFGNRRLFRTSVKIKDFLENPCIDYEKLITD